MSETKKLKEQKAELIKQFSALQKKTTRQRLLLEKRLSEHLRTMIGKEVGVGLVGTLTGIQDGMAHIDEITWVPVGAVKPFATVTKDKDEDIPF
ncbi:MAG: hypothetical protein ABSA16_18370 [Thermoguttaceae bacterium]|jgi:hypothetical protein